MSEHPAEKELRQRELHHFEVELENEVLRKRLADYERSISFDTTCTSCAKTIEAGYEMYSRVMALCDFWDSLSKGETATTRQIRAAVRGEKLDSEKP